MIFLQLSSWLGRVIANFDYSEVFGFHCVPVVVLRNCETELSYYQLNFSICVSMNLDLLIFGKFKLWPQYLRIFRIHLQLKTTTVTLLFLVNKFFKKLVNNKVVDHLEKFWFFLISSMTSSLLIQPQFWQEFLTGFNTLALFKIWHSWK